MRTILYANISFDDKDLKDYYNKLTISSTSDYLDAELALDIHAKVAERRDLVRGAINRTEFSSTSEVNAYYMPLINSINIQSAITISPIYNTKFPRAWNYGTLGFILGKSFKEN